MHPQLTGRRSRALPPPPRARRRLRLLLSILGLSLILPPEPAGTLPPGDHLLRLDHRGLARTAIVHVPPGAAGRPAPVVLALHGGASNAEGHQRYTRMDPHADRAGFVVVYPDGSGPGTRLLTWNAGSCCGWAERHDVDDVGFLRQLVEVLSRRHPLDRARVYATGLSNGAMMAYRLAAEASDLVAAVAPVAGGMVTRLAPGARPVPVLHLHSVDDPRAPFRGGLGPPRLFGGRFHHPAVEEVLARWAAHDGCDPRPEAGPRRTDPDTGHTATLFRYPGCQGEVEVALWRLTGAGHVWPGGRQGFLEGILGPSTTVIDANREILGFFPRFALAPHRQRSPHRLPRGD